MLASLICHPPRVQTPSLLSLPPFHPPSTSTLLLPSSLYPIFNPSLFLSLSSPPTTAPFSLSLPCFHFLSLISNQFLLLVFLISLHPHLSTFSLSPLYASQHSKTTPYPSSAVAAIINFHYYYYYLLFCLLCPLEAINTNLPQTLIIVSHFLYKLIFLFYRNPLHLFSKLIFVDFNV